MQTNIQAPIRKALHWIMLAALLLAFIPAQPAAAATGGWEFTTGDTHDVHAKSAAVLLQNGQVLLVGGYICCVVDNGVSKGYAVATTELYNPDSGLWNEIDSLATARYYHTATILNDGRVLVVGGIGDSGELASAELYNPSTGHWAPTGPLTTARHGHTATLLQNGQVLVAGGMNGSNALSSAELYNPFTGLWTNTAGPLNTGRASHTATLLNNGHVLIAGGADNSANYLSSAEVYNPDTGFWTTTGSMNAPREGHTTTLLDNGNVLVAGGGNGSGIDTGIAQLYNPTTGLWTDTGALNINRFDHTATLLSNGQVLVAGGYYQSSAELYNPATGDWTQTGSMDTERWDATATLLLNDQVLVAGGEDNISGYPLTAEIYGSPLPPANDDFDTPIVINSAPNSYTQPIGWATSAADDPISPCNSSLDQLSFNTVWYRFTPPADGTLTLDTFGSNYDTMLDVWTGGRGSLVSAGCNDDYIYQTIFQSEVQISVVAGQTYQIEVANYSEGVGQLILNAIYTPDTFRIYLPLVVR